MAQKDINEITAQLLDSMIEHNSELIKTVDGNTSSKSNPMKVKELAQAFLYLKHAISEGVLPKEDTASQKGKQK